MSSTVQVPMPGVHHRRAVLWSIVAGLGVLATVAGGIALLDRGGDTTTATTAPATAHVAAPMGALPIDGVSPPECGSEFGSLLAVMATMSPEAVDRITPVLSAETRAGLSDAAVASAAANAAASTPDPLIVAWSIGQLTPPGAAAITAELAPATRDAVVADAPAAALFVVPCS